MGYGICDSLLLDLHTWLQGVTVAQVQLLSRLCLEQGAEQQVRADIVIVMATLGRKILHLQPPVRSSILQVRVHVQAFVHKYM